MKKLNSYLKRICTVFLFVCDMYRNRTYDQVQEFIKSHRGGK